MAEFAGRRFNTRLSASNGFTLIELLVCVAIIAVLASILMPVLAGAKAKGKSMSCLNNLRQLSLATLVYADDFNDRLPYNLGQAEIVRAAYGNRYYNWTTPVMNWELDSDNTNSVLLTRGGIGPYLARNAAVYKCPSDAVLSDIQYSAGWVARVRTMSMNAMVGDAGEYSRSGENVNNPDYRQFFKLSQIPEPSRIFVYIDEHPDSINDGYFLNRHHSGRWTDLPASFHNGGANLTFADGHAEKKIWRHLSTRPAARPESVLLPLSIPSGEESDFEWLMDHTSIDR